MCSGTDVDVLQVDAVMAVSNGQEPNEDNSQAFPLHIRSGQGVVGVRSNIGTAGTTSLTDNHMRIYSYEDEGSSLRPVSSCKCDISNK